MKIKAQKSNLSKVTTMPGVYQFLNEDGKIIYIGKAKNLRSRLSSYFNLNLAPKTRAMLESATHIEFMQVESEFEALLLEAKLVKKNKPKYNIQLRDDKTPLYIVITKEKYPRILSMRQTQLNLVETKKIYGPFINGTSVKKTLNLIRKVIPFSQHKIGKRACLYHQIGLCDPCPSVCESQEDTSQKAKMRSDYLQNIRYISYILDGKISSLRNKLERKMFSYSKQNKFEKAQKIKNQIQMLDYIVYSSSRAEDYIKNPNLIEDIYQSELKALQKIIRPYLKLNRLARIECYDVAHLSGSSPTASMVTFINAEPDKTYYRHFRIRNKKGNDDYGSMREVLARRSKHFVDPSVDETGWGKPDLIIVDGGKGQVSKALEVFGKTLPVVGIAKRHETLVIKNGDKFEQIRLKKGPALYLVQRMRDEAHRFARRYHHKLVSRSLLS